MQVENTTGPAASEPFEQVVCLSICLSVCLHSTCSVISVCLRVTAHWRLLLQACHRTAVCVFVLLLQVMLYVIIWSVCLSVCQSLVPVPKSIYSVICCSHALPIHRSFGGPRLLFQNSTVADRDGNARQHLSDHSKLVQKVHIYSRYSWPLPHTTPPPLLPIFQSFLTGFAVAEQSFNVHIIYCALRTAWVLILRL